jgi:glutamine amidotransferase
MDVVIVQYNAGNIYSVAYAMRRLGIEPVITADPELLKKADKVIFPGVGEACTTMAYLKEYKLDLLIKDLRQPVLGICLGMQLMCRFSEETIPHACIYSMRTLSSSSPKNMKTRFLIRDGIH